MQIRKYENSKLSVECAQCKATFTHEVSPDTVLKYADFLGCYENYTVECPTCPTGTCVVINVNIPEGEYDEVDIEGLMPYKEINSRKYIRDFMRDHREDLRASRGG
jgi:hypothetical protein